MDIKALKGGYIYKIPISEIEYVGHFQGKNFNESIKSAYSRAKSSRKRAPDFFMNAEWFNFSNRNPASDVVSGGKIYRLSEGFGIGFVGNQKPVFSYKNNVGASDYVGAYPTLVRNKKIESVIPKGAEGSRGRTALGVDDSNNFYIALIPEGSNDVTLPELSLAFISAGATNAINLDGGGSTQYYSPKGNYFTGRNLRGFIGVWLKKTATSAPTTNTTPTKSADVRTVYNIKSFLRVRNKPSTILGKVVGKLYNGNKVTVLETSKDSKWCRISTGWVSSSYLKK